MHIKASLTHHIFKRAHQNLKWPIKSVKFACNVLCILQLFAIIVQLKPRCPFTILSGQYYVLKYNLIVTCADPESFVRGGFIFNFLFELFLSIRPILTVLLCFILDLVLNMVMKLHPINPLDFANLSIFF